MKRRNTAPGDTGVASNRTKKPDSQSAKRAKKAPYSREIEDYTNKNVKTPQTEHKQDRRLP
jgi:hypothetical protein